jgi:hypothetical protein
MRGIALLSFCFFSINSFLLLIKTLRIRFNNFYKKHDKLETNCCNKALF